MPGIFMKDLSKWHAASGQAALLKRIKSDLNQKFQAKNRRVR